ncbi:MAG: response regulator transcription factor [Lewinellaceae bacterium]|nr:response regulator transcription factor [Saprospiraceae bacterium]MCB9334398.1 response regulator transcription factor [Lewinellaceae bacterium]
MKIKTLIIDDNPFILDLLSDQLEQTHPNVAIVGTASTGAEALEKIQKHRPDLIFLDVELPDMSGFDVLAELEGIDFQTIFITAFSHYAIMAIRFNALDYLVKPIEPKELAHALRRYRSNGHTHLNQHQVQLALTNLKKNNVQDQVLFLPTQEGGIKMVLRDIVKIEGDRNYSTIYLANQKTRISAKTLGYFEEILEEKGFFRCHRSFILNHQHIDKLQKDTFLLKDGSSILISRRRKTAAKEWFHSF